MDESQISKILNAYNGFEDIEGFAKVVTNDDILKANSVLSISYYVEGIEDESIDIDESLQAWEENSQSFNFEFQALQNLISDESQL